MNWTDEVSGQNVVITIRHVIVSSVAQSQQHDYTSLVKITTEKVKMNT